MSARIVRILPFMLSLLLLSGCQCFAELEVSGSAQQGVIIQVRGSSGSWSEKTNLYHLVVYDSYAANANPLWVLKGNARVNSVAYGQVPPGMAESAPATALEPGRVYSVSVEGDTAGALFGSVCRGSTTFSINTSGQVVICSRETIACS